MLYRQMVKAFRDRQKSFSPGRPGWALVLALVVCVLPWGCSSKAKAPEAPAETVGPEEVGGDRGDAPAPAFQVFEPPALIKVEEKEGYAKEWDRKNFNHDLLDRVLKRVVTKEFLVDYEALRKDPAELNEYLYRLQSTDPEGLASREDRFAYWINTYNACTLKLMIEKLPADPKKWAYFSLIAAKPSAWDTTRFVVGGQEKTLNDMEHGILREPPFADPRVHAAVNCASMSCPKLQHFAFTADRLEAQLDQAASGWVNDPFRNRLEGRTLYLSKIFKWYAKDFEAGGGPVPFVSKYIKDEKAKAVLLGKMKPEIQYLEYSWAPNKK